MSSDGHYRSLPIMSRTAMCPSSSLALPSAYRYIAISSFPLCLESLGNLHSFAHECAHSQVRANNILNPQLLMPSFIFLGCHSVISVQVYCHLFISHFALGDRFHLHSSMYECKCLQARVSLGADVLKSDQQYYPEPSSCCPFHLHYSMYGCGPPQAHVPNSDQQYYPGPIS